MLRLIIIALLVWGGYYVVSSLTGRYNAIERKEALANNPTPVPSAALDGVPGQFEASLANAESQGPAALKRWLDANGRYCRDPRLGDIELDLAVGQMSRNMADARAIYRNVKARTPANSPLQARLQRLAKSLDQ